MDGRRNGCFSGGSDRTVSMFLGVRRDNSGADPDAPMPKKGSQFAHHNAVIPNLVFEEYHPEMTQTTLDKVALRSRSDEAHLTS